MKKESRIHERSLRECDLRRKANVIVAAIKKPGKDIVFNPSADVNIVTGDTLLVLGDKEAINRFESIYLKPPSDKEKVYI